MDLQYLILAFSVLVNSTKSAYSNLFGKQYLKSRTDMMYFNILCSACSVAVLFLLTLHLDMPSLYTVGMSMLFGAIILLSQISFFLSMSTGSMAYTMLLTSSGMIIPTVLGTFLWKESITAYQVVGLVVLVVTFYLNANPKKDDKITFKWLKYALLSFLMSGGVGLMQKIFQTSSHREEMNEFLMLAFLFIAVYSALLLLLLRLKGEKINWRSKANKSAAVIGVCDALMHKINLYLAGAMPSMIVFPVLNGGAIIVSSLLSVLIFKEHLSKRQIWSIGICVVAILLISCA